MFCLPNAIIEHLESRSSLHFFRVAIALTAGLPAVPS